MVDTSRQNWTFWTLVLLSAILVMRIVSLWFNNSLLFFDEAQYWFWSQDLTFGYFSKPPLLAWVIAGTAQICGSNSEFCVRLSAPFLHTGTAIMLFLIGKHLFDARVGFWSALCYALMPAVALSSTIISTDVPLLFCWSVALYAYIRLCDTFEIKWALLMGIAIGLGLNAKYAMAYFIACGIIHALTCQQEMTPARKLSFWFGVLIAIGLIVPNIIWNYHNDFVTASHTGDNIGWSGFQPNWIGFLEFLGSQFGMFGPILFGIFLATVLRLSKDTISAQHRLLLAFSVPIIGLILVQAIASKAYANWAAATYVAATVLVVEILVNRVPWGWMRANIGISVTVSALLAIGVAFAAPGQLKFGGFEPFKRTQGADQIALVIEEALADHPVEAIITDDRKLSALTQYYLRHVNAEKLAWKAGEAVHDHFQLVSAFQNSPKQTVILATRTKEPSSIIEQFEIHEYLGEREITAGEIKALYLYRLEGFKLE